MAKPYRQGSLDSLCGVYALINAVDYLCGPLTSFQSSKLFRQILFHLDSQGACVRHCTEGIVINELAGALNSVVCKHYPIKRYKPFHRQPDVNQQQYFETLSQYLAQPNAIVLLVLEGYLGHWTLIHRITDKKLMLYDSLEIQYVLKTSCSMVSDTVQKRHCLLPTHTYVLMRR